MFFVPEQMCMEAQKDIVMLTKNVRRDGVNQMVSAVSVRSSCKNFSSNLIHVVYTLTLQNERIISRFHGGGRPLMHLLMISSHEPKLSQDEGSNN